MLDTDSDDWTLELTCLDNKQCGAWTRQVGSRLHVFAPKQGWNIWEPVETRIYTFAFVDVDRIRFHGSNQMDHFEKETDIPCEAYGGDGDDELWGGGDDDFLTGGKGSDLIIGGLGGDKIKGGNGKDYIYGDIKRGGKF